MELVDVQEYGFFVDTELSKKYSNADTFFLNRPVLEALLRARDTLPNSYTFLIKDGYRTLEIQKKIVAQSENEFKESHPDTWEELLNTYTGGYGDLRQTIISNSNHRSGNAVDITIVKDAKEIDMGGVTFTEKDKLEYYEKREPDTEVEMNIRNNRRMLKRALEEVGFTVDPNEWWHWGYVREGKGL